MCNRRPGRFAGFTIVELLVVVAIVIIMLALVTPAVQESRVQAQQAQCQNNLRQLGLALHNYQDAYKAFPPGWTALHPHPQSEPRFGWTASLLPYIREAPLYNRLDFHQAIPVDDPIVQTAIPLLRCPTDPTPGINPVRSNFGTSNYSGNAGDQPFPRWAAGRLSAFWPGQVDAEYYGRQPAAIDRARLEAMGQSARPAGRPPVFMSGLFWLNSRCGFRDITDGLSQTVLVGERSYASGAGVWPGVGSNEFENDVMTECSYASPLNRSVTSFSSRHAGGVNFLIADGQVRFLSDSIDSARSPGDPPGVYQKLANRQDGVFRESARATVPLVDYTRKLTGTVRVPAGSVLVTGMGTQFQTELRASQGGRPGSSIRIGNQEFTVASIIDNTRITLNRAHPTGATNATVQADEL